MILRKRDERFSEVLPNWKGETCVLIGGGWSLTFDQVAMVRAAGVRCIAINNAYLLAPWADVCYFADSHFWKDHVEGIAVPLLSLTAEQQRERFASFAGEKCSIDGSGGNISDPGVHILKRKTVKGHEAFGVSTDPTALVTGRNSGFQALNLAILAGATKIILLGFDAKVGTDGRSHLMPHRRPTPMDAYREYQCAMKRAENEVKALGVTVLNCSLHSAIDTWPKVRLEEALG